MAQTITISAQVPVDLAAAVRPILERERITMSTLIRTVLTHIETTGNLPVAISENERGVRRMATFFG
ncbi:hypothetical protein [Trinickia sp.]|uniref:hypothetical protein n=1 Tax=Trinickia sp. TaxID=2571163 RepID=UPI003F7E842C